MSRTKFVVLALAVAATGLATWRWASVQQIPSADRVRRATVAANDFKAACFQQGISWPPARLTLLAFKGEKLLEVWVANKTGSCKKIGAFPILAASGELGPKRREGDRQVPEGEYGLTKLNPNSSYHLSVFVDYPNATDIAHSRIPRNEMGGLIFVHGKAVSIGCIAVGDDAIEKVYGLCSLIPASNRKIIICPVDFRKNSGFRLEGEEAWVGELYDRLAEKLQSFSE